MSRTLTAGFLSELSAATLRPRFFFEAELNTTTLRYWTDTVDVSWNGSTWLGNGYLMQIGSYHESDRIDGDGLEVTLLGEPSALVSLALQDVRQGKSGKLWLGFLDAAGAIIADPHLYFVGKLSESTLDDEPDQSKLTLKYESSTLALDVPCEWRYNDASQKAFYADDRGFEYMEELAKWSGYWGKPQAAK